MKKDKTFEEQLEIDSFVFHYFFNHGLFDELLHLSNLIDETENYLETRLKEIKVKDNDINLDSRFGKIFQFERVFPNMLYKGLFLHQYSVLEDSLNQICINLEESQLYNLNLKDLKGSGIVRAKLYLEKIAGIRMPFNQNPWDIILKLNRIRNIVIHANGLIEKDNKKDYNIIKSFTTIEIIEHNECFNISLSRDFCKVSIEQISCFFEQLYDSMVKMKKRDLIIDKK